MKNKTKKTKPKVVDIELPTGSLRLADTVTMDGQLCVDITKLHQQVVFIPDNPRQRDGMKFRCRGKLISHGDGTVEFVRHIKKPSGTTHLARTTNGLLSRSEEGYYLVTFKLPDDGVTDVARLLRDESSELAELI